jgi:hypothetical protein
MQATNYGNIKLTVGTAIGTAYRRIMSTARGELDGLREGARIYDIMLSGKMEPVDVLFKDLFAVILPEAYLGNARFGIEGGVRFASVDFYYMPGCTLCAYDSSEPAFARNNEMQLEFELPDEGDPRITVGPCKAGSKRVRMYPEDLAMLRETLLANFDYSGE